MTHKRFYIRAGATTTAGGTVRASSSFTTLGGKAIAREGDPVDCPACGEQGLIQCVMPRLPDQSEGKECALSDDLCICACSPPPRLVAEQFHDFQLVAERPAA